MAWVLLVPCVAIAQAPKRIVFTNRTVWSRLDWGTVTVPFDQGEWRGGNNHYVKEFGAPDSWLNKQVYIRPFGLPYPDGSYRYGELITPVWIPAGTGKGSTTGTAANFQQTWYTLAQGADKPIRVPRYGPIIDNLRQVRLPLEISIGLSPRRMKGAMTGTVTFDLFQTQGTKDYSVDLVVHGPRHSKRFRSRIGDFVVDLWVHHYSWQDHFTWELRITNSGHAGVHGGGRAGTNLYTHKEPSIFFATKVTAVPSVYGCAQRDAGGYVDIGYERILPLRIAPAEGEWGDGQSQIWRGVLSVPLMRGDDGRSLAAHVHPLVGMSDSWTNTNAYGPHGFVPKTALLEPGRTPAKDFQHCWNYLHTRPQEDSFWEELSPRECPVALHKDSGATARQPDFGLIECWDALATPSPELAEMYGYLAYGCARRPHHHYTSRNRNQTGPNGVVMLTERNAPPGYLMLDGRYDRVNSKHFLGKGDTTQDPNGTPSSSANPHETNEWTGFKKSHMSVNLLYTSYILNPWSRMLEDELDFLAESFLLDRLDPKKHCSWKNEYGQARALGRTTWSMSQVYLAKGRSRDDVMKRMNSLTTNGIKVSPPTPHNCSPSPRESMDPRRPIRATVVQYHNLPAWGCPREQRKTIVPWEEMMAVYGLSAAFLVSGSMTGVGHQAPHVDHLLVAQSVALSMAEHGYLVVMEQSSPTIQVAYRYAYPKDGQPHASEADCDVVQWAGGGLTTWTAPAAYLVVHHFAAKNTKAWQNANLLINGLRASTDWRAGWYRWRWGQ